MSNSNLNSNPDSTSRRNQDLWNSLVNPYTPYQPPLDRHFLPEDQFGPYTSAHATTRRTLPTNPAQRDASAYSAAIPATPTAARDIPSSISPYYRGVSYLERQGRGRSPPATTRVPGAYPMGPPPPPLPPQSRATRTPPMDWNEASYSGINATPPPAYSMSTRDYVATTSKPKPTVRVPKRGLDVDVGMDVEISKDRTMDESRVAGMSGNKIGPTANEEVAKRIAAREKQREQAREALRLRDEGRREAQRVMVEREEREREKKRMTQEGLVAQIREVVEKYKKEKEELGKGTDMNDVQKGMKRLSVGGVAGDGDDDEPEDEEMEDDAEEDWEVVEGPNVGHVIADEFVDSDDSDTWH